MPVTFSRGGHRRCRSRRLGSPPRPGVYTVQFVLYDPVAYEYDCTVLTTGLDDGTVNCTYRAGRVEVEARLKVLLVLCTGCEAGAGGEGAGADEAAFGGDILYTSSSRRKTGVAMRFLENKRIQHNSVKTY